MAGINLCILIMKLMIVDWILSASQLILVLKKLHVICKNKGTEKEKSDRHKTKNINSRMALLIIDEIEFKSTERDK